MAFIPQEYNLIIQIFMQNIEALQQAGAMALLRPLLLDNVPRWVGSLSSKIFHEYNRVYASQHPTIGRACTRTPRKLLGRPRRGRCSERNPASARESTIRFVVVLFD